jgi:hypothetical protein
MAKPPTVIARVLMRSAEGDRPGIDVPISAGTVGKLAPSSETVAAVADHFRRAGFVVLGNPGITIGISGTKALFERHFGCKLAYGADHAYTVREARTSDHAKGAAESAADPTSIPTDGLPASIRRAVSQIALETAVSIDQPDVDP